MAVENTTNQVSGTISAFPQNFAFNYPFFATSDLVVTITDQTTLIDTILTETTHYVVTLWDEDAGTGNVQVLAAAGNTGDTITVHRAIPYTQTTELTEGDDLPAATLEQRLDRTVVQILQLKARIENCLEIGETSGAISIADIKDPTSKFPYVNASDVLTFLTATQANAVLEAGGEVHTTFADNSARTAAVPEFLYQLAIQLDTEVLYYANGVTAGDWAAIDSSSYEAASIAAAALATDAVETAKIKALNVTTGKLAALAVTAGKLATDSVTTAKILDANVTLAKLADLANGAIIARITAGTGVPEAATITQILDLATGTAAQGDILYRGASAWTLLAKGTNGHVLTQGASVPSWAAAGSSALAFVSTATPAAVATVDIALGSTRKHVFELTDLLPVDDNTNLELLFSNDDGVSFETVSYDDAANGRNVNGSANVNFDNDDGTEMQLNTATGNNATADRGISGTIEVRGHAATGFTRVTWHLVYGTTNGDTIHMTGSGTYNTAEAVDKMRLQFSGGNIATGTIDDYTLANS